MIKVLNMTVINLHVQVLLTCLLIYTECPLRLNSMNALNVVFDLRTSSDHIRRRHHFEAALTLFCSSTNVYVDVATSPNVLVAMGDRHLAYPYVSNGTRVTWYVYIIPGPIL